MRPTTSLLAAILGVSITASWLPAQDLDARITPPSALAEHAFRFPGGALIAHALGGIDGHTYTNSVEALQHNLEIGDDELLQVVTARNVPVVTMSRDRYNEGLVKRRAAVHVDSFVHTVNGVDDVSSYLRRGVRGLFTDCFFSWGAGGPPGPVPAPRGAVHRALPVRRSAP